MKNPSIFIRIEGFFYSVFCFTKTFEIYTFAQNFKKSNFKKMPLNKTYEKELSFQADRRRATVEFIKIVSDLWYDKSIELVLFRNQLMDRTVSEILNLHEYAGAFVQKPISIFDSVEIAQAIKTLDLPPAKLDIGKLTYEFHLEDQKHSNALDFVSEKLKDAVKNGTIKPKDVVLYGFGRIGRLVARELMAKNWKRKPITFKSYCDSRRNQSNHIGKKSVITSK